MAERREQVDCIGLRCPEPILVIARAARGIGHLGGVLEVHANDAAFPIDLKSWCLSTNAELVSIEQQDQTFRAIVRVPQKRGAAAGPPSRPAPPSRPFARPMPPASPTPATGEMLAGTVIAPAAQPPASPASRPASAQAAPSPFAPGVPTARFDLRGLPADAIEEELSQIGKLRPGMAVTLLVPPSAAQRAVRWCASGDHELVAYTGEQIDLVLGKRNETATSSVLARPESSQALVPARPEGAYDCVLFVLHNDLESLLAALLVANGAAAQGMRTMMFFAFWGLNLLRADRPNLAAPKEPVSFMQRMFKWMMPKGPRRQGLGQLNFGGMGAVILGGIMQKKNIRDLPSLLASAQEQNVRFLACTMSMAVMGIGKRDLEPYPNLDFGGVTTFVEAGRGAQLTLVF